MSQITVTLPDGSTRAASAGAAVSAVAADISPRLARQALAAIVDGRMVDLSYPLEGDAAVRFVTPDAPEALQLYRHSTAHLLAAAVTALFPEAQCGIGPAIDEGFFYDFVVDRPFVPEDLEAIERKMGELAKQNLRYERKMMSKAEAKAYFDGRGEPLKVQLIEEKGGPIVSCYTIEDAFIDFCTGPHVPSTGRLKAFKVLSQLRMRVLEGGFARNQPMQRIYGTAFFKDVGTDRRTCTRIEQAKERDHRRSSAGSSGCSPSIPGRPEPRSGRRKARPSTACWPTTCATRCREKDYLEVRTPLVFNKALWETSGHWDHYRENMFLLASDGEPPAPATGNGGGPSAAEDRDGAQFALKAMNCPGHMLMFASEGRSYRDLPLRFHDQGVLHRQEASGVLSGLTRVRQFSQDDAHCFITEDQIGEEVERLLRLIDRVYGDFGLDYAIELSTRPEDYLGELETWNHAEAQLRGAIEAAGRPFTVSEGDGSFYGPKIDVHVTDAIGRRWQCATIQLDYQMPQRFGLKYVGADNADHTPVLIHRAIFGSFERFIALLIEQYAGAFPLWLAPVQVRILNIADRHAEYGRTVQERLAGAGLRVELDDRREKIGLKIREAQLQKIPRMLVIGDREVENGTVAVRSRTQGDLGASALDELIRTLEEEVRLKRTPATE